MKCTLYKFMSWILSRILPIAAWRVRLTDRHFSRCPRCREKSIMESVTDEQAAALLVTPGDADALPSVWYGIRAKLEQVQHGQERAPRDTSDHRQPMKRKPGWAFAAIASMTVLSLYLITFFFVPRTGKDPIMPTPTFTPTVTPGSETPPEINAKNGPNRDVAVDFVKVGSKNADFYFFHSKDPNKLIVWAQRKNGGNNEDE